MNSARLTVFAACVFIAESAFYAVIPPLVPGFVGDLHMTTTQVGVLVAAYPAGVLLAAIPSMVLVNRRGVRTTTIAGLTSLLVATLGFAWSSTPWLLDVSRLVQGAGGAVAWAGALAWLTSQSPADRRGTTIGGAVGAALIGMVTGPAIGAAASHYGRGVVFSLMAIVMAALAVASPTAANSPVVRRDWLTELGHLFRSPSANLGNGLLVVVGVVNGTVATLVPLVVIRREGSAVTIAVIVATTYLLSSFLNMTIGHVSDRIGRLAPTVAGLVLSAVLIPVLPLIGTLPFLGVATVVAAASVSGLWTPTAAMVSDGAGQGPSAQAVGVATLNAAWAAGITTGALALSRLADTVGITLPFLLVGILCGTAAVVTFLTYSITGGREAATTDRTPHS